MNIPEKLSKIGRRYGPMVVGEAAAQVVGAVPGVGVAAGVALEVGASNWAENAVRRRMKQHREDGPTVDDRPIYLPEPRQSVFLGLITWHLSAEIFDRNEGKGLGRSNGLLEAGHIAEAEAMLDTLHIVNVEDASRYYFVRKGYNLPESAWEGEQLLSVPGPSRYEQCWEALTRAKLRGEPLYDFISRESPRVRYRRQISDVSKHFGGIKHLAIAAIREPDF